MKISWKWLAQWVDLDGLTPQQVSDKLTLAGLEGEGVHHTFQGHDKVVVARIDAIEEHPKADKLVICRVDVGDGQLRQIVCGAKNMKAGDLVPAALPGSQPPALDFEIGERKMMGTLSQGMLCSEDELGLAASRAEGLLILDPSLTVGQPIFEALGLEDTTLEIGLTPNRPDCLCHRGIAREVAALFGRRLKARIESTQTPPWVGTGASEASELATLSIEDADGCPRYAFAIIEGLKVGPSPDWLRQALERLGLRSINNIVDVTNYVLMDVGQPLHAFDLDKLEGAKVVVRRAQDGESFRGLDHKDYKLSSADLVIADGAGPVALAGVMGGERTEVGEETTRVLIECAYFDPTTVRKSARQYGLHTDSSHRFERGIDPGALRLNLHRAVALMLKTQEGLEGAEPVVAQDHVFIESEPVQRQTVALPHGLTNAILGTSLTPAQVVATLESIDFLCEPGQDDHQVQVPTSRPDVERPIDLIEEVARIVGFDQIPSRLPASVMGGSHKPLEGATHPETLRHRRELSQVERARELLMGQGLYETLTYSFMGAAQLDELLVPEDDALRDAVAVANPMNPDQAFMRTTLATSLVQTLKHNWAQRAEDVAIFELGRCYFKAHEEQALGLLLVGQAQAHWGSKRAWDFYDAKGMIEAVSKILGVTGHVWVKPQTPPSFLHPGVAAYLMDDQGQQLGWVGQLHPAIAQQLEISAPVLLAQVWLDRMRGVVSAAGRTSIGFKQLSRYPAVTRDFALLVDDTQPFAELEAALLALCEQDELFGQLFESHRVFDVYRGDRIEEGKRSVAMEVVLRAADRTLSDEEISKMYALIISQLTSTGAVLR